MATHATPSHDAANVCELTPLSVAPTATHEDADTQETEAKPPCGRLGVGTTVALSIAAFTGDANTTRARVAATTSAARAVTVNDFGISTG